MVKIGDRYESFNYGWVVVISEPYESGTTRKDTKVDIQFENSGKVYRGVLSSLVRNGNVRDGSVSLETGRGSIFKSARCGDVEILDNSATHRTRVKFLNTGHIQTLQIDCLLKGLVFDKSILDNKNLAKSNLRLSREAERKRQADGKIAKARKIETLQKLRIDKKLAIEAKRNNLKERTARKYSEYDRLLESFRIVPENFMFDHTNKSDGILDLDFKDRDGNWVLRFSMETKFIQTRLGILHNNVLQRARKTSGVYKNTTISDKFKCPQSFSDWVVSQVGWGFGYHLEKDLLGIGSYSEETSVFLPREINQAIIRQSFVPKMVDGPLGMYFEFSHKGEKLRCLSENTSDAIFKYKNFKKSHIVWLANTYKNYISDKAYQALLNFEILF